MEKWQEGMYAALARNIAGMTHLSEEEKAKLLASEFSAAISATLAGKPFVEIYGPHAPANVAEDVEEAPSAPSPVKRPTSLSAKWNP